MRAEPPGSLAGLPGHRHWPTGRVQAGAGHADERLEVRRPRPGVAGERPPHSILDCGVLYGIVAGTISLDYSQHVLVCTYNIPY